MRKRADAIIRGAHAPSRAALGALAKRIFVACSCPKLFGDGAEKSTRGACAPRNYRRTVYVLVSIFCIVLAACRPDMMNQPKAKALSESDFSPTKRTHVRFRRTRWSAVAPVRILRFTLA